MTADRVVLPELFKSAMRRLAATVTIVTTAASGSRSGMTATAVTSLTTDPPALLLCVNQSASIHSSLTIETRFCINILGETHGDLSLSFGGKADPEVRFGSGDWFADAHGVPALADAQANVFCTVDQLIDYGTHSIVIGRVYDAVVRADGKPLMYGDGGFLKLAD